MKLEITEEMLDAGMEVRFGYQWHKKNESLMVEREKFREQLQAALARAPQQRTPNLMRDPHQQARIHFQ